MKTTTAAASDVLGTAAPLEDGGTDSRAGDTAEGQRMGVFARATFTPPGGEGGMIDSKNAKKKVFSAPRTPWNPPRCATGRR